MAREHVMKHSRLRIFGTPARCSKLAAAARADSKYQQQAAATSTTENSA